MHKRMNRGEEQRVTDDNIVYLVSHAGDDHLEDDNEGVEKGNGVTRHGGLKAVETAMYSE